MIPRWAEEAALRFLAAGWTPSDVLHALDYRPDGSEWLASQHPHGTSDWAEQRLRAWLDGFGNPIKPRSHILAEQAERLRREQEQQRREWARLRVSAARDPVRRAQETRARVIALSPAVAAAVRRREREVEQRRQWTRVADGTMGQQRRRWKAVDETAEQMIEASAKAVEPQQKTPSIREEDPVEIRRQLVWQRARLRAHLERSSGSTGAGPLPMSMLELVQNHEL